MMIVEELRNSPPLSQRSHSAVYSSEVPAGAIDPRSPILPTFFRQAILLFAVAPSVGDGHCHQFCFDDGTQIEETEVLIYFELKRLLQGLAVHCPTHHSQKPQHFGRYFDCDCRGHVWYLWCGMPCSRYAECLPGRTYVVVPQFSETVISCPN